jgi:glucosyl-dolichyl phosphate glucuronosyltransferase
VDQPVDVSVIISAFNRGEGLRDTLTSLLTSQTGDVRFEVIAVDNNSTDNTAAVIKSFIDAGDRRLRYLFEPQQGVSYGRNAAIRVARAPILAFTDDDVVVAPDWLSVIKRHFDAHPQVDYVSGKMRPVYDGAPPAWLARGNQGPCVVRDHGEQPRFSEPGCFLPGWATANIAFRREVFERVGLFSGDFPRGQDLELIIRVWRANGRGMYAPDMVVSHRVPAERLTKTYHRMWHSREGDIRGRLRFREIFDRNQKIITGEPAVARVLGVPRFMFRELVTGGSRWVAAMLRGDAAGAFAHESALRQTFGYMRTSFAGRNKTATTLLLMSAAFQ